VEFPSPFRGAVVAATGNNNEKVNLELWDFSQRSIGHRDTIAVMNFDEKDIACDSGRVDEQHLNDAFAVGFDGRAGDDCKGGGTSLSAPRVAWLFAAADAVRAKRFNAKLWGTDAMNSLLPLRSGNTLAALRLDPVAFLRAAVQR